MGAQAAFLSGDESALHFSVRRMQGSFRLAGQFSP